ncbi:adhesion G-protein coupled receptor G5 [Egretta garzetta]|uniref:adhesion G-protein coupled receptor G5 n=1 Tax=Egretta garzetta TaxID=188379 RepID=UPI00163B6EF6|nr:adhesion G-protein coupled receptor G5 [Egretta garzetta]
MPKERTTAMSTPLLIALLCLTTSILQAQGMDEQVLENMLQQGCKSTLHTKLKQLEEKLAHQEKHNFTGSMIETYVFKFMTKHFRGLNLSSRMPEQGVKSGAERRLRHAMSFPAELMEGIRAREVEQKLICIYIHSPCIFRHAHPITHPTLLSNSVLGAFLQSGRVAGLSHPVEIQFWHNMVLDASNAICVFWQPSTGAGAGSWSMEGCKTMHREGTVICHCNHLTYFAVLLVHNPLPPSLFHLPSFLLPPIPMLLPQQLRDNTTRIAGAEGLCRIAAALLHASLLCSLAWMGTEAFHLLLLLVKVYNIYIQHYLLKLCLFAWGLPTLAVVAVFVFKGDTYGYHTISTSESYRNVTMCWLTSLPAHYATLGYAALILLFNLLVLGRVVMILRRIRRQKEQARKDWAMVLGLTCLLGITWGLAFFSFNVCLIPQLYLFTILNSLQGLFVCLWYVSVHRRSKLGSISNTSR